jgi:hypothetical protein
MDNAESGIKAFLKVVTKRGDLNSLITTIKEQQRSFEDSCLRPSDFAAHLIIDLYDSDSDKKANVTRIAGNLENASDELLAFSKRVRALAKDG